MIGGHQWNIFQGLSNTALDPDIPGIFHSLQEARESLEYYWYICRYSTLGLKDPSDPQTRRRKYCNMLEEWSRAFDAFLQLYGDMLSEKERKGVAILQMHKRVGHTALNVERSDVDDEMRWDKFCPVFEEIVTLAEFVVEPTNSTTPTEAAQRIHFSLDMSINGCLYDVAARCRHPVIRRKAVSLLRSASRQEGVWNPLLTAKVAERVIEIEEEGLVDVKDCSDVPDWARISDVDPIFNPEGKRAVLRYSLFLSLDRTARKAKEEILEW